MMMEQWQTEKDVSPETEDEVEWIRSQQSLFNVRRLDAERIAYMRFHESAEQSQIDQNSDEARLAARRQNGSVERTQYRRDPENAKAC